MKKLTYSANKFETDKGTIFGSQHSFTEFYDSFFEKYIGRKQNILEIGVYNGASLKMYDDYFNGDCEIYGIDINKNCKKFENNNTHIFILDQGNRKEIEDFKSKIGDVRFDVILDDGSHHSEHQMISMANLFDLLKDDGIYIIEDLHGMVLFNEKIKDSSWFWLNFKNNLPYLSDYENERLRNCVDEKTIFIRENEKCGAPCGNISSTAVIKFKNCK